MEVMMATKAVPIQMEAEAHHDLRLMAAAAGKSMGGLIWLMVKVLRRRLEECHLEFGIQGAYTSIDVKIIDLILAKDLGEIDSAEFQNGMNVIAGRNPEITPTKIEPTKAIVKQAGRPKKAGAKKMKGGNP
jgi:hypothetical protein